MKEIEKKRIIEDCLQYGSKDQAWAPEFVLYMKSIVMHPAYEGMPDAVKMDGKIQWEAPSNRGGGQYQFTHNKRRDWWKNKAESIGIDTSKDQWISRTAKTIHPTGEKPCKRCGKTMQIAYIYPSNNLINRFKKSFKDTCIISNLEPITEIIQKYYDIYGDTFFDYISRLFSTDQLIIPDFHRDLESLISWISNEYVNKEPTLLSPGVMSNAPDRFDGFHSFNRCCRGKADTGRHVDNLRSYNTDRRVFEFWSEGDWIAADRLMGLVKTKLRHEICFDGNGTPPTPDHIGPLSLGFCHRPEFKLLSRAANSAKNNRMTMEDVHYLLDCESRGIQVVSWYAKPLWDLRKLDVNNNEKALRLSKMLRDNQRNAMYILCKILDAEKFSFLIYLLELKHADKKVEFNNLRAVNFFTAYDNIITESRMTKYSIEQKARRIRIAFDALRTYKLKENRHLLLVEKNIISILINEAISTLENTQTDLNHIDTSIKNILLPKNGVISEDALKQFIKETSLQEIAEFKKTKQILSFAMGEIGRDINAMWNDDRYVRQEFEL